MHEAIVRAMQEGTDLSAAIIEAARPTVQAIDQLLKREPFAPFRIGMTSGSSVEVRDPRLVKLSSSTLTINEPDPESGSQQMRCVLALIHVVSLDVFPIDEPVVVGEGSADMEGSREQGRIGNRDN